MKEKIIVGLSGGVDSAVAVHLLKNKNYEVIGVFLDMLGDDNEFQKAKILAKQLRVQLIRKDIRRLFQKEIVSQFVNDYKNGLTPNPCVICNPRIKFKYLLKVADELGIEKIATGHYARVSKVGLLKGVKRLKSQAFGERITSRLFKKYYLQKAKDKNKDQSYFLYRLTQKELQRIKFPLGDLLKSEVKKMARELNLKTPKTESQDVCFLKNYKNLEEFFNVYKLKLKNKQQGNTKNTSNLKQKISGDIIDSQGNIIGKHRGLLFYTIGQRKGLDIGGNGPFYVLGKDFKNNCLIVGNNKQDEKLIVREVVINKVYWINKTPLKNKKYQIKIRYQMKSVEAKLEKYNNKNIFNKILKTVGENKDDNQEEKWRVKCLENVWAVAPGQSLVIYDDDQVVGGGIIV